MFFKLILQMYLVYLFFLLLPANKLYANNYQEIPFSQFNFLSHSNNVIYMQPWNGICSKSDLNNCNQIPNFLDTSEPTSRIGAGATAGTRIKVRVKRVLKTPNGYAYQIEDLSSGAGGVAKTHWVYDNTSDSTELFSLGNNGYGPLTSYMNNATHGKSYPQVKQSAPIAQQQAAQQQAAQQKQPIPYSGLPGYDAEMAQNYANKMNRIISDIANIGNPQVKQSCVDKHVKFFIPGVDYTLLKSSSKVEDFSSLNEFLHVNPYLNNTDEKFQFNPACTAFIKTDGSLGPLGNEIIKNIENEKLSVSAYEQLKEDAKKNNVKLNEHSDKRYAILLDDNLTSKVSNLKEVCPKFDTFSEKEKKHFWAYTFGAMAQVESSCQSGALENVIWAPNDYLGHGLFMMEPPHPEALHKLRSVAAGNPNPEGACGASAYDIRYNDSVNIRCTMDALSVILRGGHTCEKAAARLGKEYLREQENYKGCSKGNDVNLDNNYFAAMRDTQRVCDESRAYKKKINIFIKMYKPCGANFKDECGRLY